MRLFSTESDHSNASPKRVRPYLSSHRWRQAIGLVFLTFVVIFWTASGFFTSAIFADDSYSKPYFVVYFNTAFFIIPLIPIYLKHLWRRPKKVRRRASEAPLLTEPLTADESQRLLASDGEVIANGVRREPLPGRPSFEDNPSADVEAEDRVPEKLNLRQTMKLSFRFCLVWFVANWFTSASYGYTSVASCTILTSTSSIFTLIIGSFAKVEKFTIRKLVGVIVLFCGVFLTTVEDLTGSSDSGRGKFPHKTPFEVGIGDAMALISAMLYGVYATGLTKSVGNETKVNMPVFFGFVGIINIILLWPGFIVLHFSGMEKFEFPQNSRVWSIVLLNAIVSLVSDLCWGYSMVLLSPLVTTVGLSLTIPLSLIGQMIINHQSSTPLYWLGAIIVILSFIYINYESGKETRRKREFSENG